MTAITLRRIFAGGAAALAAAGLAIVPAHAHSVVAEDAQPGGFATAEQLWTYQTRMNSLAARVESLTEPGYSGVIADPGARRLRVFWKGSAPTALRALAAQAPADIPVDITPARFTRDELLAATARAAKSKSFTSIGPAADGSGLVAGLAEGASAAATTVGAVPVTITPGVSPKPFVGRQADSSPYWGGGRWRIGRGGCSTGFGVVHKGTTKVLSAGHCGANGQTAIDGDGDPMGQVSGDNNARDTLLIHAPAQGKVFIGDWTSARWSDVGGKQASYPGNRICTSGASSGLHCDILVTGIDKVIDIGYQVGPVVAAEHNTRQCAAAPGDSGGPVISFRADHKVDARGTIVAGNDDQTRCPGSNPTGSYQVWYVDITKSLPLYDAALLTR
ncbi:hypothetical protein ACTG9Q_15225 [Actinokineospora sp. 24-640]